MDTDMEHGGFDWDNTPERHMPWKAIHYDHNFEPLFSLYPELRGIVKSPYAPVNEIHELKKMLVEKEERIKELENKLMAMAIKSKETEKIFEGVINDFATAVGLISKHFTGEMLSNQMGEDYDKFEEVSAVLSNKPTKH